MRVKPILSIIVVSFNTKDLLKQTLKSIFKSENGRDFFEVIVVDNSSKDGSAEMVRRDFKSIVLLAQKRNLGFGRANNLGAQKAKGKYLLFLNSDTIVGQRVLSKMVDFLEKKPLVGVLAPKLVLKSGAVQPFCIGYKSNLGQIFKNRLAKLLSKIGFSSSGLANLSLEYWDWKKAREVDWVTGAALMIQKKLFEKIKGFDTKFFMYFEDQDLCLRVKSLRFGVWVLPKAKIIHLGGKSLKLDSERRKRYYQSQDYFFKKHFGSFAYWLMRILAFPLRK